MPARQPAGSPAGGQFAVTPRAEAEVELEAARGRVVDEGLRNAAAEVLEAHPNARGLLLQEDTSGPTPVVVAYMAVAGDGQPLWLDPDVTDAVHGHLGVLDGLVEARASAAMAGATDVPNGVWLRLGDAASAAAA